MFAVSTASDSTTTALIAYFVLVFVLFALFLQKAAFEAVSDAIDEVGVVLLLLSAKSYRSKLVHETIHYAYELDRAIVVLITEREFEKSFSDLPASFAMMLQSVPIVHAAETEVFATSLPKLTLNLLRECQKHARGGKGLVLPDEAEEAEGHHSMDNAALLKLSQSAKKVAETKKGVDAFTSQGSKKNRRSPSKRLLDDDGKDRTAVLTKSKSGSVQVQLMEREVTQAKENALRQDSPRNGEDSEMEGENVITVNESDDPTAVNTTTVVPETTHKPPPDDSGRSKPGTGTAEANTKTDVVSEKSSSAQTSNSGGTDNIATAHTVDDSQSDVAAAGSDPSSSLDGAQTQNSTEETTQQSKRLPPLSKKKAKKPRRSNTLKKARRRTRTKTAKDLDLSGEL